jgi:large subunit ribosomal protein L30
VAERVKSAAPKQVKLTLRRSLIGRPPGQRRIAEALGLRRVGATRVHPLTASVAGAVRMVGHLVSIEEVTHGKTG